MKSSKIESLKEELVLPGLLELQIIRINLFGLDIPLIFNEPWQILNYLIKTLVYLTASLIALQRLSLQLTNTADIVHQIFPLLQLLLLPLITLR